MEMVNQFSSGPLFFIALIFLVCFTLGVSSGVDDGKKSIDCFKPESKEDFAELAKMIVEKLSHFEVGVHSMSVT